MEHDYSPLPRSETSPHYLTSCLPLSLVEEKNVFSHCPVDRWCEQLPVFSLLWIMPWWHSFTFLFAHFESSVAFCQMRKCNCLSQGAVVRIKWQDKCDCAQEAVKWQRIVGHLPWVELGSHTQARLPWLLWFEEEISPGAHVLNTWLMVDGAIFGGRT